MSCYEKSSPQGANRITLGEPSFRNLPVPNKGPGSDDGRTTLIEVEKKISVFRLHPKSSRELIR